MLAASPVFSRPAVRGPECEIFDPQQEAEFISVIDEGNDVIRKLYCVLEIHKTSRSSARKLLIFLPRNTSLIKQNCSTPVTVESSSVSMLFRGGNTSEVLHPLLHCSDSDICILN